MRYDLAELDKAHVWHPFTQHAVWNAAEPLIVERAEGNWLIDTEGRRYLDGVSSLWTNVHGHRHPKIDEAIRRQLDKVAHSTLLGLTHPTAIELAARLVAIAPAGLDKVFYSDNGATSVEVAVKMAFQYHQQTGDRQRTRFAALRDAYHGDTLGAVSIGSVDLFHAVYKPLLFDAVVLPAPTNAGGAEEQACLERAVALLEAHGKELAALVFEPLVQGAAGMKMHSPGFLRTICELARKHGVLLVADEVAVGFGRLGTMFAMEQVGVAPDFLCLAKGISGGYLPLAATLTTQAVYDGFLGAPAAYRQLFHGHTYTGNPLACAAGLASLDVFEEERVIERVRRSEEQLAGLLEALRTQPGVAAIRHKGVMVGIDLEGEPGTGHRVAMACRPRGAIVRPLGNTLVLNPPLSMEGADLTRLVEIVAEAIAGGTPAATVTGGMPAATGTAS